MPAATADTVRRADAATVVLTCGLPASGRTTTAERLHARLGGVLIRSGDGYQTLRISLSEWVRRTRASRRTSRRAIACGTRPTPRWDGGWTRRSPRGRLVIVDAAHGEPEKRAVVYVI